MYLTLYLNNKQVDSILLSLPKINGSIHLAQYYLEIKYAAQLDATTDNISYVLEPRLTPVD